MALMDLCTIKFDELCQSMKKMFTHHSNLQQSVVLVLQYYCSIITTVTFVKKKGFILQEQDGVKETQANKVICLSVCVHLSLSVCVCACLSASVSVCKRVCMHLCGSVCMCLCVSVSVCVHVCLRLCWSLSVCVRLSVCICHSG